MKEICISKAESGQTCIKYLKRLFVNAPNGLIYKQIRKKNIILNGKKITGNEVLKEGDKLSVFFSEDTISKFTNTDTINTTEYDKAYQRYKNPEIIYEDEHILFINKPINMLSQKASPQDLSANEWIIGYLLNKNSLTSESLAQFMPSVCNRLDRNTGGLLAFGKTLFGVNTLNTLFRDRLGRKIYHAIVVGKITEASNTVTGYLSKDSKNNKVTINSFVTEGSDYIKTIYTPIRYNSAKDITELEIELVTGKTHQIRAHLASIGHPIIGDYKYGIRSINNQYKKEKGLDHQLLYAVRFEFPEIKDYPEVSRKIISIDTNTLFDPYF